MCGLVTRLHNSSSGTYEAIGVYTAKVECDTFAEQEYNYQRMPIKTPLERSFLYYLIHPMSCLYLCLRIWMLSRDLPFTNSQTRLYLLFLFLHGWSHGPSNCLLILICQGFASLRWRAGALGSINPTLRACILPFSSAATYCTRTCVSVDLSSCNRYSYILARSHLSSHQLINTKQK